MGPRPLSRLGSVQGRNLCCCGASLLPQPLNTAPCGGGCNGNRVGSLLMEAGEAGGCIPLDWWDWADLELPPLWSPGPAICFVPISRCQPGWFNLQPHNPAGCTSCFCYGHSAVCMAATGYEVTHVRSDFSRGTDSLAPGKNQGARPQERGPGNSGGWETLGLSIPPLGLGTLLGLTVMMVRGEFFCLAVWLLDLCFCPSSTGTGSSWLPRASLHPVVLLGLCVARGVLRGWA